MIRKITPGAVVSTLAGNGTQGYTNGTGSAATFHDPQFLTADKDGNVYVSDNYLIRKIDPNGVVTNFAGNGTKVSSDGLAANAGISPGGLAVDASGTIYFVDGNNTIRKISVQ